MKLSRRTLLKLAGLAGATGVVARASTAGAALRPQASPDEMFGVLVDTTRCLGCRSCEVACSESNGLPEPEMLGDEAAFEEPRSTSPAAYTVVNRYRTGARGGEPVFRKAQCMHCVDPGCASACPVRALEKTAEGPVVYHENRCIGCRYCMVACPFTVPKFEYSKALPYIRKCTLCTARLRAGQEPACVEACPAGALQFGKRKDLIEEANTRIYQNPGSYVRHVYGEHEAGGTGILYISNVPFERLGLPADLGTTGYAQLTVGALSAVPIVLTLWPPLLMALYAFRRSREDAAAAGGQGKENDDG